MSYFLGVDIGGTKTEVVLLCDKGKSKSPLKVDKKTYHIIERKRMATQRKDGYQALIKKLSEFIHSVLGEHKILLKSVMGIGVGIPASVHPETGMIADLSTSIFDKKNLAKDLGAKLKYKKKIHTDNDANLFAYAETYWGAGLDFTKDYKILPNKQNSLGVTLGTGVGGGLILKGEIYRARQGGAGEIGHTQVVTSGRTCFCGRIGCAEIYLSGTGLELDWKEKFPKLQLTSTEIFKHPDSKNFLEAYQDRLAHFLANLTNTLGIDYIVLGGGVSNQARIYQGLEAKVQKLCFIPNHHVRIYQNRLSDSAGVLGAALLPIL